MKRAVTARRAAFLMTFFVLTACLGCAAKPTSPPPLPEPPPVPEREDIESFLKLLQPDASGRSQREYETTAERCFPVGAKTDHYADVFKKAARKRKENGFVVYTFYVGKHAAAFEGNYGIYVFVEEKSGRIHGVAVSLLES
jgi:hypothetical protein